MGKSIGTLYIDIISRTDQLEKDMTKVKNSVAGAGEAVKKTGEASATAYKSFQLWNSFQGRGMLGITADMMSLTQVLKLVQNEFKYVYDNINNIPGIPAEAVQGVNEFKVNLKEARNAVDGVIASLINWGLLAGKAIGVGFADLLNGELQNVFGNDKGTLDNTLDSLDKIREAQDPAYLTKVTEAIKKLSDARKEEARSLLPVAERIAAMRNEQQALQTHAATASKGTIDSLKGVQEETEAFKLGTQAGHLYADMMKRLVQLRGQENIENNKEILSGMSQRDRIYRLQDITSNLERQIDVRTPATRQVPLTPAELDKVLKAYPQLLKYQQMLREEMAKIKPAGEVMAETFVTGIQSMSTAIRQLVTGASNDFQKLLKTLADKIIETFIDLALINPLLNATFGGVGGYNLLPAMFGAGAKASGGPASGLTWVGEQGPELLNLPGGSSVMSNSQSRAMSGGGGGNTYVIDARGADSGVEQRLTSLLIRLAGPGVVEQRSLSAANDRSWRGKKN